MEKKYKIIKCFTSRTHWCLFDIQATAHNKVYTDINVVAVVKFHGEVCRWDLIGFASPQIGAALLKVLLKQIENYFNKRCSPNSCNILIQKKI